jgi:hypothetical protein
MRRASNTNETITTKTGGIMKAYFLKCDGPRCNSGICAAEREAAITPRHATAELREEATKLARAAVTRQLTVTPHTRVGVGAWQTILFSCSRCGHQRSYGSTTWLTGL